MQDSRHDEDNHIKNYSGEEAVKKLKEIAEEARTCMFATFDNPQPLNARPMALQTVDPDGTMHFLSADSSLKNEEIEKVPFVQLFFANTGSSEYLSVYGRAVISKDRAKIKELWNAWIKTWFQEGPDDPEVTLISVTPLQVEYWDTKHNRVVQYLKIAASMVTGKTMDDGVEGELKV
jgi:general stress protein 26